MYEKKSQPPRAAGTSNAAYDVPKADKQGFLEGLRLAQEASDYMDHFVIADKNADGQYNDPAAEIYHKTRRGAELSETGAFVNDLREGVWTAYSGGYGRWQITYQGGQSHGPYCEQLRSSRVVVRGQYENDEREGTWQEFYHQDDAKVSKETNYKAGKKDGAETSYFENGQLYEQLTYEDGFMCGPYEQRNEQGRTVEKGFYKNNKPTGLWQKFDSNGVLQKETTYADVDDADRVDLSQMNVRLGKSKSLVGVKNGVSRTYYPNGTVESETMYQNGVPVGLQKTQTQDGRLDTVEAFNGNGKNVTGWMGLSLWALKLGDNIKMACGLDERDNKTRTADQMAAIQRKYPQYKSAA